MKNKKIIIVRHGETSYNQKHIVQGSGVDSSLNDLGRKQAQAFYDFYSKEPFDLLVTSGLKRTHETMAPFIEGGLNWIQTPDINEIGWGVHEGKAGTKEMIAAYKALIAAWSSGDFDAALEGGESARELATRLRRFFDWLVQRPESNILVCSHGRAMRCMIAILKGQHLREMEVVKHNNTGAYTVHYANEAFEVIQENDIRHLDHLE